MKDKIRDIIVYSLLGITLIGTITNTFLICTSMRDRRLRINNIDDKIINLPEDEESFKERRKKSNKDKIEDKELEENDNQEDIK